VTTPIIAGMRMRPGKYSRWKIARIIFSES